MDRAGQLTRVHMHKPATVPHWRCLSGHQGKEGQRAAAGDAEEEMAISVRRRVLDYERRMRKIRGARARPHTDQPQGWDTDLRAREVQGVDVGVRGRSQGVRVGGAEVDHDGVGQETLVRRVPCVSKKNAGPDPFPQGRGFFCIARAHARRRFG